MLVFQKIILFGTFLFSISIYATDDYLSCDKDSVKQAARSKELQEIFKADQADRSGTLPPNLSSRDRIRLSRVGQIFGEGCITSAKDYLAAAIVFQHGDRPDHFFQAFLFSMRGTQLGDLRQKRNMAVGIDRYLVHTNHKQIFASQAFKPGKLCWCLEPVESSFSEAVRKEYMGSSFKDQMDWVNSLNKGTACETAKECDHPLAPSPKGTVPGLW